jgi:hypothetical protein
MTSTILKLKHKVASKISVFQLVEFLKKEKKDKIKKDWLKW